MPDEVAGIEAVAALVRTRLRTDRIPGLSVAVVHDGAVRWLAGFGHADLGSGAPAEPGTPYLWFSMTKIVTATAVCLLADRGRLDLDAPVPEHYPLFEQVDRAREVTVRHLLGHSSGLDNPVPIRWVYPAGSPAPDRSAFVRRLLGRHRGLRSRPGARVRYSNLGYLVLGEVIAHVSGRPYEQFVREQLLAPLGMAHTGFSYEDSAPSLPATGYQPLPAAFTPLLRAVLPSGIVAGRHGRYVAYHPFYVSGAAYGGLVGPVSDAAELVLLHLGDGMAGGTRLLSASATAAMRHVTVRGGPIEVGMGWYRPRGAFGFVEHLGGGSGFLSVMRLYPDRNLGIVAMANTTRYGYEPILEAIANLNW